MIITGTCAIFSLISYWGWWMRLKIFKCVKMENRQQSLLWRGVVLHRDSFFVSGKWVCTFIPTSDPTVHTNTGQAVFAQGILCGERFFSQHPLFMVVKVQWAFWSERREQTVCTVTDNFVSACSSFHLIRPPLLDGCKMKVFSRLQNRLNQHSVSIENAKMPGKEFYWSLVEPLWCAFGEC